MYFHLKFDIGNFNKFRQFVEQTENSHKSLFGVCVSYRETVEGKDFLGIVVDTYLAQWRIYTLTSVAQRLGIGVVDMREVTAREVADIYSTKNLVRGSEVFNECS